MTRSSGVIVLLSVAVLGLCAALLGGAPVDETKRPEGYRLYEMRTYYAHPGKIDGLHNRFRHHTNHLFVKHGMTLVGYWTAKDDRDTLIYLLAYPDMEQREKSWKGFFNDPAWREAYEASIANGRLVRKVESKYLVPTDYSPQR